MFEAVNPKQNFPKLEEEILKSWRKQDTFKQSIKNRTNCKEFVFYDGPPFATGLPHYGHLLAGIIKDIIPRYKTMCGYKVERRFGWDCHGLPVEMEIQDELNLKSNQEILSYGVGRFNEACRSIVQRYTQEWQKTIDRIGRWVDFENDYKTMDSSFMESIWWTFNSLFEKGLIYKGFKILPYSWKAETSLSNFEANLNYKSVQDPAITVKFQLKKEKEEEKNTYFLVWTTTPWTLISNLALCVNDDIEYIKFQDLKSGEYYYSTEHYFGKNLQKRIFEGRIKFYKNGEVEEGTLCKGSLIYYRPLDAIVEILEDAEYNNDKENNCLFLSPIEEKLKGSELKKSELDRKVKYKIIDRLKGSDLKNLQYHPLFPYAQKSIDTTQCYSILSDDYVTDNEGTGIVHLAPAYGEDDYRVCLQANIPVFDVVDESGNFKKDIDFVAGKNIKEADKDIIKFLKKKKQLFKQDTIQHNYPYCWRTDTPLMSKAMTTWFVNVEKIKKQLIDNNQKTYWVPEHIKEGRFGQWLENARDWDIGRNRFWGTPIPIWESKEGDVLCISSIKELEEKTKSNVQDLHKHFIDKLTITHNGKTYKRVDQVLDCWFESGAMPFAQNHYPFENKEYVETHFPADFIAEGLDQTRGWFYTLMVLSTGLMNKSSFNNVIVNGLILSEDGKKMSKRLKNYPDPGEVIQKYGADALRLYMISSNAVIGEDLKFSENGVKEMLRSVIIPLWNSFSFFVTYANIDKWNPSKSTIKASNLKNPLDRWLLSVVQNLAKNVSDSMNKYLLNKAMPSILQFIDQLNNWYIRRSRRRFWKNDNDNDKLEAYYTLYHVMISFSKIIAPFTPFLAEKIYQTLTLKNKNKQYQSSVHLENYPEPDNALCDSDLEEEMMWVEKIVYLARSLRTTYKLKIRQPLSKLTIITPDKKKQAYLKKYIDVFIDELNIKSTEFEVDEKKFVNIRIKPNLPILGKRFGNQMPIITRAIANLSDREIEELQKNNSLNLNIVNPKKEEISINLKIEEVLIIREIKKNLALDNFEDITIALETTLTPELVAECRARDIVNLIQKMRKDQAFNYTDRIIIDILTQPELINDIKSYEGYIKEETLCTKITCHSKEKKDMGQEKFKSCELIQIDIFSIKIKIEQYHQ